MLSWGRTRGEFAEGLGRLDAALRDELINLLKVAEEDESEEGRKCRPAVQKLLRTLEKNKKYRFDFLFGVAKVTLSDSRQPLDSALLLLTEALKGAGIARYIAKAENIGRGARPYAEKIRAPTRRRSTRGARSMTTPSTSRQPRRPTWSRNG